MSSFLDGIEQAMHAAASTEAEEPTRDETMPSGPWEFDAEVTAVFDDMLARSIPELAVMRAATAFWVEEHVFHGSTVVDLGCSRGGAIGGCDRPEGVRFVGFDESVSMVEAAKEAVPSAEFFYHDLRNGFPTIKSGPVSVVLAILTLQFVPIEHRQELLAAIYENLAKDGALIVVEKVLGSTAGINGAMVDAYYELKQEHGYSDAAIATKARALEGRLVPLTAAENVERLYSAGFSQVDCFWRWMNFAGWVAVKS